MNKTNKFSPEVRERVVRLVQEHHSEYSSLWAAVESIAPKIGGVPEMLLDWDPTSGHPQFRGGLPSLLEIKEDSAQGMIEPGTESLSVSA